MYTPTRSSRKARQSSVQYLPASVGQKRSHVIAISDDDESEDDEDDNDDNSSRRPCARDYPGALRSAILWAYLHFRCAIATQCPFPGQPEINNMAASAWHHGCDDMGISFPIDDEKIKIVRPHFVPFYLLLQTFYR